MATKTAVIQKKIGDVVYDLMFKTTAANVVLEGGTTLDAKIDAMWDFYYRTKHQLTTILKENRLYY